MIEDQLNAVKTLDDLRRVLVEARAEKPRVLDFNILMREQADAERLVREQWPQMGATRLIERFSREHPALCTSAEAANLTGLPAFVLAVGRAMNIGATQ